MPIFRPALSTAYRREGDALLIELDLRDPRQMFNRLDPAPFIEKDLDDEAETYIVDAVGELRSHRSKKLIVYLPPEVTESDDARSLPRAVHTYFAYRAEHAVVQLRRVLRDGVLSLCIGLAFLVTCLMLGESIAPQPPSRVGEVVREGLLIMGWVAMWRPLETFLYDWWPIRRRVRLLADISHIVVEVRPRAPAEARVKEDLGERNDAARSSGTRRLSVKLGSDHGVDSR